jgi:hypothetical protein
MKDDPLNMGFNDFYEGKIKPNLLELEQERKKLCVRLLKSTAIAALAFPGVFLAVVLIPAILDGDQNLLITLSIFCVFLYLFGFLLLLVWGITLFRFKSVEEQRSLYLDGFSRWIMDPLVTFINPSFTYSRRSRLSESEFKNSGLYGSYDVQYGPIWGTPMHSGATFISEDEIIGEHEGVHTRFSECELYTVKGSGKSTHIVYHFKGLFITSRPKNRQEHQEHTMVVPVQRYHMHWAVKFIIFIAVFFGGIIASCLLFSIFYQAVEFFNSISFLPDLPIKQWHVIILGVVTYFVSIWKLYSWLEKEPPPNPDLKSILNNPSANNKKLTQITHYFPALQGRFDVLSDDPQAASKTLDQKTLRHLMEFHDKINRNIRIAFIGDKIQTAIWHEETIRAPRIWRTILNKKYIQGFLQEYSTVLKVVNSALSR